MFWLFLIEFNFYKRIINKWLSCVFTKLKITPMVKLKLNAFYSKYSNYYLWR